MEKITFSIRPILHTDYERVIQCIQKAVSISNGPDYPKKIILYQLQQHYTLEWINKTIQDKYFVVAEYDSNIIGTGAVYFNELRSIFVDPDYQRHGIGTAIVSHLEQTIVDQGYKEVFLESSITAVGFYSRLGYNKVTDDVVEWLEEKIRTIEMKKSLKVG